MWSRRRWSSSSFSRDGTRWAPHPFASLPSYAAGGLASLGLGATFALAGAASADASDPSAPQTAFGADVRVSSAALRDVSRDVADGPPRARRRALRLLSKITLYIDHHDAVLAVPEVRSALLEALRLGDAVDDQSRAPSRCLTTSRSNGYRRRHARQRWRSDRDAATLAILAADPPDAPFPTRRDSSRNSRRTTPRTKLARRRRDAPRRSEDLADGSGDDEPRRETRRRAQTTRARGRRGRRRATRGTPTARRWCPRAKGGRGGDSEGFYGRAGTSGADRDVARHACAAWFGLAASNAGRAAIVASGATRTVVWHARSRRDRVAHRFAVGAAARFAAAASAKSTTGSTTATLRTATLRAATRGLVSGDGQAACYATGAMRAACEDSNLRAKMARWGAVGDVVRLLANPGAGWATDAEAREARKNASVAGKDEKAAESAARRVIRARERTGGRECAMRALETFAESGDEALKRAILKAPGGITAVAEIAAGTRGGSEIDARLRRRAAALLTKLGL